MPTPIAEKSLLESSFYAAFTNRAFYCEKVTVNFFCVQKKERWNVIEKINILIKAPARGGRGIHYIFLCYITPISSTNRYFCDTKYVFA